MQKPGLLETNIDKSCLHTRQHPIDLAFVYIADNSTVTLALDADFLQRPVLRFLEQHARLSKRVSRHADASIADVARDVMEELDEVIEDQSGLGAAYAQLREQWRTFGAIDKAIPGPGKYKGKPAR